MDTIGIGQLRAELADYITRTRRGERFLVTDGGVPMAELGPVSAAMRGLWELVDAGTVTWSGGKPVGARIPNDGPSVADAVVEGRR